MSETTEGQQAATRPNMAGKWTLLKNENFDAFLSANGANWLIRKMAGSSTPSLDVTQDGDKFNFKLTSMVTSRETSFTVGQPFEEKQHSGDITVATPAWSGDKLVLDIQPKEGSAKPQTHTRTLEDGNLVLTLQVGDVTAKRIFQKAE